MASSRRDTLDAPPGAGRVAWLLFVGAAALVVLTLLVGVFGSWLLALLVPALAWTLFLAARVVMVLVRTPPSD